MSGRFGRPGLALAVLGWLLGVGCGSGADAPGVAAPPVMVAAVEAHRLEVRIGATGQLLARADATVAAQVGGQITRVVVDEGAAVETGAVVLEIDPERRELELASQRARLAEIEAALRERERDFARVRELEERGVASQARLDRAETELRLARSRRAAARAQLGLAERAGRDSSVIAPFAGFVGRRHVSEGEFVAPGAPLFDLVALDPIEVEFFLAERDSSRVEVGDPLDVRVAPFPDESFSANVTVVSPRIDPATRTLRVKARLANPEGRLLPGLFARVDLGVAVREGVPMVLEEAVLRRADGAVAFRLVGNDRVERRTLELGEHRDGRVEVLSGLAPGDYVVVRGHTGLVDGAVVSLRDAHGAAVAAPGRTAASGAAGALRP